MHLCLQYFSTMSVDQSEVPLQPFDDFYLGFRGSFMQLHFILAIENIFLGRKYCHFIESKC